MNCLNTFKYYFEQLGFVDGLSNENLEERLF